MKASAAQIDGSWIDVFKDPVTAKGSKTSKKGRLALIKTEAGKYQTVRAKEVPPGTENLLETVYENGTSPGFKHWRKSDH